MTLRRLIGLAAVALLTAVAVAACSRDPGTLDPWPPNTDPIVFEDQFTGLVEFYAFGNSQLDALSVQTAEQYEGTSCLRIRVPAPGGKYAGGAFVASQQRDLSGYTALTFYAKASRAVTLEKAGLGNDNTGTSKYDASVANLQIGTTYKKYVIPIPLPARLRAERGLFFFSAPTQGDSGYDIYVDEVKFEFVPGIADPRPVMSPRTVNTFVGAVTAVQGTRVTFKVDATDVLVNHNPAYFDYTSSDSSVAIAADGVIRVLGVGSAVITARLDTLAAAGAVNLNAGAFTPGLAPVPTRPAKDVISIFSNVYPNRYVDKWSADWDDADVTDLQIYGDDLKLYTNLIFAAIEFTSQTIDASAMTHLHMDVWFPTGTLLKIKLADFGPDGVYNKPPAPSDDSESQVAFTTGSTPPLVTGTWMGLEMPLANFTNLASRAHLAQLVIEGNPSSVYVDNIYFHK
jgi:hypothetical protein